jgi:Bacterial SCP ortholog
MTKVTRDEVDQAIRAFNESPNDNEALANAVRKSLEWFAQQNPGRAVEVRVPPYLAVQILGGTTHRRGTPPAVVEMSPQTWLDLFTHKQSWEDAEKSGQVSASGLRSDLGPVLSPQVDQ